MREESGKRFNYSDFLITVVVYNISIDTLKYLNEITESSILIYDNSKESQKPLENTVYYHSSENVGVSTAYNYSFDFAQKNNKKFLIILDQDTFFCKDYLDEYIKYANMYGNGQIYAPVIYNETRVYSPYKETYWRNICQHINDVKCGAKHNLYKESLINSGLMIPVKVNTIIGGFNNNIKLDFSDTYYIEQYKKNNDQIILMNIKLEHKLSGDEGKNYYKEFHRFKYFCNGAKEFKSIAINSSRIGRIVIYRLIRLIVKYKKVKFARIYREFYLGDKVI